MVQHGQAPSAVVASGVTSVGVVFMHSCAVVNGAVQCLGLSDVGQVGDGSGAPVLSPVPVL